jgi:hypothetical protein
MWMTPRVHLEKLAIARHPSEALYNSEAGQAGTTAQIKGFSSARRGKRPGERLRVACMSAIGMIAGRPFMDMRTAIA